jgi:flagellar biosynthetic protein FliR
MVNELLPWLGFVGLLSVRLLVALALSPPFTGFGVPASVRVALVFALAALSLAGHPPATVAVHLSGDASALLLPVLAEVLIGGVLGLSVHVVMAALALAGRLMDVQIGFGIASVFDPVNRSSTNVIGMMTSLIGVVIFMVGGAHWQLANLIARSVDVLPIGVMPSLSDPMRPLLAAGSMFSIGLALAAPVAIALLMTDLAIAVTSRNMPQLNVFVLAVPIKVFVGFLVLMFAVRGWSPLLERAFEHVAVAIGVH